MPNIKSVKKALRGSQRKQQHNNFWKNKVRASLIVLTRSLETNSDDVAILNKNLTSLQKALDKASKVHVLHKNKANRIKSRYAKKISALSNTNTVQAPEKGPKKVSTRARAAKSK